ncbi:MAG: recombinase family protein [Brevibacterium aurantiacum]|uniref:recombinase family protein n=1 Tax=Brevibacterium aurantiacum TaxID=273384 RepID=UPI003F8FDBAD
MEQAAAYLRISQDRTGLQAGIQRQREDCLVHAAKLTFAEPQVFVDNDVSAFDGGRRPGYDALAAQVRAGVTHIIVWHVDRLYRQPRELEDLIDLVEQHPVRIEAVRGGGFDLNTTEGRLMARQLVAIAAYESGHKSDRVKRANKRLAEQGRWHGPARYGYGPGGVLIPEQAAVIRQMADRFLAGQSLRSITAWLNRSGIPPLRAGTGTSGLWHPYTVRSVLASARISGQRAYAPDTRADPAGGREILGPGDWEPIITPEETAQIRTILADPARRRATPARPTLLGGIARCGKCGAGLTITGKLSPTADTRRYTCQKDPSRPERGGLSINATHLNDYITERVLYRLSHPRTGTDGVSTSGLLRQVAEINIRIGQLEDDYQDAVITRREHRSGVEAASEALRDAERRLVTADGAIALYTAPIGNRQALETWWDALEVIDRRAVITTLIARLRIAPGRPGRSFDRSRVRITYHP